MSDLANMTSVHGEVNGYRFLRWLRSGEQISREAEAEKRALGLPVLAAWHAGRAALLMEMANDLAAELTPPDYPDDDGDTVDLDDPAMTGGPEGERQP